MADQVPVRPDESAEVPNYLGGMVIDGVAASEALDSSGEILDVEGADISDLKNGLGVLNWEHENGAKDVIGKIIYAHKVFKQEDCEDDRQREYWDQLELPFIYHQARLYDGAGHEAARAVAAMIRDHAANHEPILVRFSIEGSTLEKDPKDPRRLAATVARRVAATIKPCNRSCHSGLVRDPNGSVAMTKSETGDLAPLHKTLTAGGGGVAPGALTGLAALQPEHLGKKWVAVSLGALRDYRDYPWDRGEFGRVLKHLLPEAPPEYFDSFMDVAEKIRVPKQLLKKKILDPSDGYEFSHETHPEREVDRTEESHPGQYKRRGRRYETSFSVFTKSPKKDVIGEAHFFLKGATLYPGHVEVDEDHRRRGIASAMYSHAERITGRKVVPSEDQWEDGKALWNGNSKVKQFGKSELYKNNSETPPTTSVAPEPPMTLRGQPVSPNRHLSRPTFDEHAGILHTPKGSFPMYIPGREDDPQVFIKALSDPQVEDFHGRAVENWSRMRDALRNGKIAPEAVMHATLFSQLSPSTAVPVQELQYGHLIDMMRETGIDARSPEFAGLKDNWLARDRGDKGPAHEAAYYNGLRGAKSWGKGGSRASGSFQKFPLSTNKWDNMADYHRMHQGLTDLVNRHRTDGRSATRELMENKVKFGAHQRRKGQVDPFPGIPVNGLAPKTSRYLFGMLGAENVVVPDTHVSRHLFGLDKNKDSDTIDYVKRVLWDERNTPVLEGIDRYYAKHHPAVRFLREHPKHGSLFSEDEQALFPAFWRHWLAIPPDERARGMKSQAFNAETDHTPFWRAVDPYVAKSEESTRWRLPAETAAQHDRWVREHGEVPALMLYYHYLAPKLMGSSKSLGKAIGDEAAGLGKLEGERVVVHNKRALPPDVHARAEEAYNRHAAESRGYDYRPNINKRMRVHLIGYSPYYNEDTFEFEHEPLGGTMGVRPPLYEGDNRNRPFITWPAPDGAEEWRGEHHTKVPSDMAWRGMDWEGWQNAVRAGHIKSLGNYNLDGQEGLTCWSPSVDTAINYSSGFAPFQHAAGHHVPGVVIGVPRSKVMGPGEHPGIPSSELGHVGEMPISAVTHAFLVHPKSAAPHTQELRVGSDSDLHHDYEKFSTARWNRGAKTSRRVYEGSGGGGGGNAHYVTPFSVNTSRGNK